MKLPRYTDAQTSVVSELQSLRRTQITPAEAVAAQGVKFGAITEGIATIGDVIQGIAEIKAEEEFTDAKMDYEAALNKLDTDIDAMPVDMDDLGNPVYDPKKIVDMESGARKSFGDAIRDNLKSSGAKRAFDKYLVASKLQRDAEYISKAAAQSALFTEAIVIDRIDGLVSDGEFDLAHHRNSEAAVSGAIGPLAFKNKRNEINLAEESAYFFGITNAIILDEEAAEQALSEIDAGERDGKSFEMNPAQLGVQRSRILSRYLKAEKSQEDDIKNAQFANYLKLVELNNEDELTEDMIMQAASVGIESPRLGINQSDFERLMSDLGKANSDEFLDEGNTAAGTDYFTTEAQELLHGPDLIPTFPYTDRYDVEYNWGQRFDRFVRDINAPDNGVSYNMSQQLLADVRSGRTALLADRQYQEIAREGVYRVTGFEPDKMTAMMSSLDSRFRETIVVGQEFNRAITTERLRLGPGKIDQLGAFMDKNAPIYKLKVNNALLSKVGVKFSWPESGQIDDEYVNKIQDQMSEWLRVRLVDSPQTAARDIRAFKNTVLELERLNGIDIRSMMTEEERGVVVF